jgi:hypothetical protein
MRLSALLLSLMIETIFQIIASKPDNNDNNDNNDNFFQIPLYELKPPSTGITMPVTKLAASEHR